MKFDLNKIIEEGKKNGIEYNERFINDSPSMEPMCEQTYVNNLNSQAMLTEETFNNFQKNKNIDWEHIKKVIDLSETKYENVTIKNKTLEKYLKDE